MKTYIALIAVLFGADSAYANTADTGTTDISLSTLDKGSHADLSNPPISHVVTAGDTLWDISKTYGCRVKELLRENPLPSAHLRVGDTLRIPSCSPVTNLIATSRQLYKVAKGDTLGRIAGQYATTVRALMATNAMTKSTIFPGETIWVTPGLSPSQRNWRLPLVLGQSVGWPSRGKLSKASQLTTGPGYFIRRPHRSYGASHAVAQLQRVLRSLKKRFPKAHRLAIGDLSAKKGGRITMHASHQTGLDVDLGFFFKKKPLGYPQSFVVATAKNIHFKASWALLTAFSDLAGKRAGVDRIFMTYSTQRLFYRLARKNGVSKTKLKKIFQYPRGKFASGGVVRHEPGHDEHIHVRFLCPPKDKGCAL